MSWFTFLTSAALWTVVQANGQISLTGKFREDVTLVTGAAQLHGEYEIIWSRFQEESITVLIHYDNGDWVKKGTKKYQLDEKTGSLTIRSLIAHDSGLYQVQIFNGNKRTPKIFNLTVVGAPSKYRPTPAQASVYDASQSSSSADHRPADPDPNPPTGPPQALWIAAVLFVLALVACTVLVIKNREPIKGIFRGRFSPRKPEEPESSKQEHEEDTPV